MKLEAARSAAPKRFEAVLLPSGFVVMSMLLLAMFASILYL